MTAEKDMEMGIEAADDALVSEPTTQNDELNFKSIKARVKATKADIRAIKGTPCELLSSVHSCLGT